MPNFIPVKEACSFYGLNNKTMHVSAFQHKKKHGDFPKWYKKDGRYALVNIDSLFRIGDIDIEISNNITNPLTGIFWYLSEDLNMSETRMAEICAHKSIKFKSEASWRQFISRDMFSIRDRNMKITPEYNMLIDFFVIMTRWVYDTIIVPNRANGIPHC